MRERLTTRRLLAIQGYCDLDDATVAELGPWIRWSPATCAVVMATGTILGAAPVLWSLAVVAAAGAALPFHPFDLVYNHLVRRLTGTRPLPHHASQRRFACGVAAVWLTVTGLVFHAGATTVGYVLGGTITAAAALAGTVQLCIPSLVFNALFPGARKDQARPALGRVARV
jgi:hypothetical protein